MTNAPVTGTALATRAPQTMAAPTETDHARAFEPRDLGEAVKLAQVLFASRLLPKALATPEAVVTAIVLGRELGLSAMQAIRGIHVIEGKPTLSADMMVALCKQRRDVCAYFTCTETSGTVATYETQRVGEPKPTKLSFTLEQAKAAGVVGKDNWRKFPDAMLRARASSALARIVYPDLVLGIYDPDELEPAPAPPRDVTPPAAPKKAAPQPPPPKPAPVVEVAPVEADEPGVVDEPAQSDAYRALAAQLDAATTSADLNAVAKAIAQAKDAGSFLPGEREALRDVYKALDRKIRFGAAAGA